METKRESFKAKFFILRVSKARNSPVNSMNPLYAKRIDSQVIELSEVQTPIMAGKSSAYKHEYI